MIMVYNATLCDKHEDHDDKDLSDFIFLSTLDLVSSTNYNNTTDHHALHEHVTEILQCC